MRVLLVTILLLSVTFAGICQTPSRDTAAKAGDTLIPVPAGKLRVLIHDREAFKISRQQVLQLDSINDLQAKELAVDSEQLTAMRRADVLRQSQLADKDRQLGFSAQRETIYLGQIRQGAADLRSQKRKTVTVGTVGTALVVFLTYLLIKK